MHRRLESKFCDRERPSQPIIVRSCRARSKAEFISRMAVVVEEADETVFWLELLSETGLLRPERTQYLLKEANELVALFGASLRTSKRGVQ